MIFVWVHCVLLKLSRNTDWTICVSVRHAIGSDPGGRSSPAVLEVKLCDWSEFYFRNVFQKL